MLRRPSLPRPSANQVDRLRRDLQRALGDAVVTDHDVLESFAGDESEQEPVLPDAVVRAATKDQVIAAIAVARDHGLPITPRGAGSGKSGGAVPVAGGVVLSCMGMASIKEIDTREHLAVVEPGVILGDLYEAVEAAGLFYPPDPNSWRVCALGGNLAENAGGPRAFKYGVTRDWVLGLEVITGDGTRLRTGRRTRKGVTGYDLTALMVGSEGTLGVITEATLKLIRKPPQIVTLLGLFADVHAASRAVEAVVSAGLVPRCLELLDGACVAAMRGDGVAIDARAGALLVLEVDGEPEEAERQMEAVGGRALDAGALDVLVAQDAAQRERLWQARRELSHTTRRMARHKISEDVVVPRRSMADLVDAIRGIAERTELRILNYGHAGDGNLHVNLLWDEPEEEPRVERALDELFRTVVEMGGTLSGEHGIGSSKREFLHLEQDAALIETQRRIKAVFDPAGILNPGKIFPTGHRAC